MGNPCLLKKGFFLHASHPMQILSSQMSEIQILRPDCVHIIPTLCMTLGQCEALKDEEEQESLPDTGSRHLDTDDTYWFQSQHHISLC